MLGPAFPRIIGWPVLVSGGGLMLLALLMIIQRNPSWSACRHQEGTRRSCLSCTQPPKARCVPPMR